MSDDSPRDDASTEPKPDAAKTDGPETSAETSPGTSPEAAARPQAGEARREPPYRIFAQYIKDLSVENPQAPEIYTDPAIRQVRPQVAIDVTTRSLGNRMVEVVVHADVKGRIVNEQGEEQRTAYLIELAYGCAVEVGAIEKQAIEPLLMIEVPRVLFPYVRAILSENSRDAGHSILMLPPIDFLGIYRAKKQQGTLESVDPEAVAQETAAQAGGAPPNPTSPGM
jgi:preprotein translocase subunit SecB